MAGYQALSQFVDYWIILSTEKPSRRKQASNVVEAGTHWELEDQLFSTLFAIYISSSQREAPHEHQAKQPVFLVLLIVSDKRKLRGNPWLNVVQI